ncbi:MAG: cobalamin biosynthesis protein [Spirochaetaceae bacterium]|jgi:cobalt-precorrin 5A hydrolase|nr:cobalamin biosynthesis protein [Spirochaetaceae bacterium]
MTIALFAFSGAGQALKAKLAGLLEQEGHRIFPEPPESSWSERVGRAFHAAEALIFIGACGIAVRGIAPFVASKTTDPAVLAMDEKATWVIALLSGHIGGANALARSVGALLKAQPVITTATDLHQVFAVDLWAKKQGLTLSSLEKAKVFSSRLLAGQEIPVKSDYPLPALLPKGLKPTSQGTESFGLALTIFSEPQKDWLRGIPRRVYLGIGCRKGIRRNTLDRVVAEILAEQHIDIRSIAGVGTIDLKKKEPGLLELCQTRGWTLTWYSLEELKALPGNFTASAFVEKITGLDNVCERSAVRASEGGKLLFGKRSGEGITVAGAEKFFPLSFEEDSPGFPGNENRLISNSSC